MATKKTAKTTVGLSAPWFTFYDTIKAIFARDESVIVNYKDERDAKFEIIIAAKSAKKLNAIQRLIGSERVMGNITVIITYKLEDESLKIEDFEDALADTGYFEKGLVVDSPILGELDYVIISKEIVQFYNDNTADYCGNTNIVAAEAIRDILAGDNVPRNLYICTKSDTDKD